MARNPLEVRLYNVDSTKPVRRPKGGPVMLKWGQLSFPRPEYGESVTVRGPNFVKMALQMADHNGFGLSLHPPAGVAVGETFNLRTPAGVDLVAYPEVAPKKANPTGADAEQLSAFIEPSPFPIEDPTEPGPFPIDDPIEPGPFPIDDSEIPAVEVASTVSAKPTPGKKGAKS